jgi:hypothetical protein
MSPNRLCDSHSIDTLRLASILCLGLGMSFSNIPDEFGRRFQIEPWSERCSKPFSFTAVTNARRALSSAKCLD